MRRYAYIAEKAADGTYSAYVPDLPGCTTSSSTVEEVRECLKDAISLYIESLREHNEPIPAPTSIAGAIDAA